MPHNIYYLSYQKKSYPKSEMIIKKVSLIATKVIATKVKYSMNSCDDDNIKLIKHVFNR